MAEVGRSSSLYRPRPRPRPVSMSELESPPPGSSSPIFAHYLLPSCARACVQKRSLVVVVSHLRFPHRTLQMFAMSA
eukprot:606331-Hanusia_phi.AAC.1